MADEGPHTEGLHCDHEHDDDAVEVILEKAREQIAEHGLTIIATVEESGRWLAYSVGMQERGWPEVVIRGLPPEKAHALLEMLYRLALTGTELTAGVRADLLPEWLLWLVPSTSEGLGVARRLYGPDFAVLQLVWPDNTGAYPWDDTYAAESHQPRLPRPE